MSSASRFCSLALAGVTAAIVCTGAAGREPLRVCADPNNMPFSDRAGHGFENAIAELVAKEMGRTVSYFWAPQRRAFVRNTLNAERCDVIIGVPARFELVQTTRPYYRSSYVFVARRDRGVQIRSFDDQRLRRLRVGIQLTGDDYENPPPAQALAVRHIIDNVRGYTVYGDYSKPDPQRDVVDAVAKGTVDVAVVWGPMAGYFAAREPVAMEVTPVSPERDGPSRPFRFEIAMGVRRGDRPLHDALDSIIAARGREIREILARFHVPLV
jgi:mxaJ protein